MIEYRIGDHFQAKPNNDFICFFHLKNRKKKKQEKKTNQKL